MLSVVCFELKYIGQIILLFLSVVGALCTWEAGEVVPDTPTLNATCEILSKVSKIIFVALFCSPSVQSGTSQFFCFLFEPLTLKTNQPDACRRQMSIKKSAWDCSEAAELDSELRTLLMWLCVITVGPHVVIFFFNIYGIFPLVLNDFLDLLLGFFFFGALFCTVE